MAGGGDMSSHGIAHDTKTEKSDVCHDVEIPVEDSCSAATQPGRGMADYGSVMPHHVGASRVKTISVAVNCPNIAFRKLAHDAYNAFPILPLSFISHAPPYAATYVFPGATGAKA
jgi:hypothetical protein